MHLEGVFLALSCPRHLSLILSFAQLDYFHKICRHRADIIAKPLPVGFQKGVFRQRHVRHGFRHYEMIERRMNASGVELIKKALSLEVGVIGSRPGGGEGYCGYGKKVIHIMPNIYHLPRNHLARDHTIMELPWQVVADRPNPPVSRRMLTTSVGYMKGLRQICLPEASG